MFHEKRWRVVRYGATSSVVTPFTSEDVMASWCASPTLNQLREQLRSSNQADRAALLMLRPKQVSYKSQMALLELAGTRLKR
jgi:hypothetical protein